MKNIEETKINLDNEYSSKENMINEIYDLLEKYSNNPNSIDTNVLDSKILGFIDLSNNIDDIFIIDELFEYLREFYYYDNKILKKCTKMKDLEYAVEAIDYLNDIVRDKNMGLDDLADYILENECLSKYIHNYSIVNGYSSNYNNWNDYNDNTELEMDKRYIKSQNIYEIMSNFHVQLKDSKIALFINKLSVGEILKILPFNLYVNLNDNIISVLKQFIKMYMSYEKAILFVDKLDLSDIEKTTIIEECYNKKVENINKESQKILNFTINNMLNSNLENINSELLADIYDIEYNKDLCENMLSLLPNIKNFESLSLLVHQLIKKENQKYSLDLEYIDVINLPEYEIKGNSSGKNVLINYQGNKIREDEIYDTFNTLYHELRHLMQDKIEISNLSISAIMNSLEKSIMSSNKQYYNMNYEDTFAEIDAREWGYFKTYQLLKSSNLNLANKYLKQIIDNEEFINDRKILKDKSYFCNLMSIFMNDLSKEEIRVYREDFPNLRYIIDEDGNLYTLEYIEEKLNNCNEIEFTFYKAYEKILLYGIDNNYFKSNKDSLNI